MSSHDKKQFKKLRSYLGRCKQILQAEIKSVQAELEKKMKRIHANPESFHEKRKREIPRIIEEKTETIELIDQLMVRVSPSSAGGVVGDYGSPASGLESDPKGV